MIQVTPRGGVIEIAEVHSDGSVDQLGFIDFLDDLYVFLPEKHIAQMGREGLTFEQQKVIQGWLDGLNGV